MNIANFVLIIFVHVGSFGKTDSNSLATAYFETERACIQAGNRAKQMTNGTVKDLEFICAPTK